MKSESTHSTHRGSRHTVNQDAIGLSQGLPPELLAERGQLLVVADGYGKDEAGSAASQAAVQGLTRTYYESQEADTGTALVKAVQHANEAVVKAIGQPGSAGSTLTAAVVRGTSLHVAHIGDSRAYLLRAGQLRRLTHDHTWGAEQMRAGKLKPEQVAQDPKRGQLTRALGLRGSLPKEQVEHRAETLQAGDVLLLCSDGLTDAVAETDLATALGQAQAAEQLIALAGQRGGTDDVSVGVLQVGSPRVLPANIVLPIAVAAAALVLILLAVWLWPRGGSSGSPTAVAQTGTVLAAQITAAAESATSGAAPQGTGAPPTSTLAPTHPGGGATPAPNKTPTPTQGASAAVAAVLQYPAPALLDPQDNAEFRGRDASIRLQWRSVGPLAAGDAYVVSIDFPHDGAIWHDAHATTSTEYQVPQHVYDNLGGDRRLIWRVTVWRRPTIQDGLPVGTRVGEESAARSFVWKAVGGEGLVTPAATPTFES